MTLGMTHTVWVKYFMRKILIYTSSYISWRDSAKVEHLKILSAECSLKFRQKSLDKILVKSSKKSLEEISDKNFSDKIFWTRIIFIWLKIRQNIIKKNIQEFLLKIIDFFSENDPKIWHFSYKNGSKIMTFFF